MSQTRLENFENKEEKTNQSSDKLVFINKAKSEISFSSRNVILSTGLIVQRVGNKLSIFDIKNNKNFLYKSPLANNSFQVVPISNTYFGLCFVDCIFIMEGTNTGNLIKLKFPASIISTKLKIHSFSQNPQFFAVTDGRSSWIVDSSSNKWHPFYKHSTEYELGVFVLNNDDIGVIEIYPSRAEAFLKIYNIDLNQMRFTAKGNYTADFYHINLLGIIQSHIKVSPASNLHFSLESIHFPTSFFKIHENSLIQLKQSKSESDIHRAQWLPDGSLLGKNSNKSLKHIVLTSNNKIQMTDLNIKCDDFLISPEGDLFLLSKKDEYYSHKFYKTHFVNMTLPFSGQALQRQEELQQFFPTGVAKIIVEYTENTANVLQTSQFTLPIKSDFNLDLRKAIQKLHSEIERDIASNHSNHYFFRKSLEDQVNNKLALEYFASLLYERNTSFIECLKVALSSIYSKQIHQFGKKIPLLNQAIQSIEEIPKRLWGIF